MSVVIPALDEEATIGSVVEKYVDHPAVLEVLVSDNSSSDGTAHRARQAGARVVSGSPRGYGHAVSFGLRQVRAPWVYKIDADLRNAESHWLDRLLDRAEHTGSPFIKACWNATTEDRDLVTNMVARPILRRLCPNLAHLKSPLSGVYLFQRALFAGADLSVTFALDVQMLVLADRMGVRVEEVEIESVFHGRRTLDHYFQMADELVDFFLGKNGVGETIGQQKPD